MAEDIVLTGDLLIIRYVLLDDALGWLWDQNPKKHDLDQLAESIRQHGFRDPSIYDTTLGAIPAGNGRLQALAQLHEAGESAPRGVALDHEGRWHVPLVFGVDARSRAMAERFGVDHNNLTLAGGNLKAADIARIWRQDDYLALLQRLAADDALPITVDEQDLGDLLALFGSKPDIDSADDPGADLDHAAELQAKWQTERGQLWLIPSASVPGQAHRLLCGDSTNLDDVTRLMNGQRAHLFATDPPYLVDYDGTNHPHAWNTPDYNKDWSGTYHDWDDAAQGEALYDGFIAVARQIAIEDNAAWYCWHASRNQAMLERMWEKHGAFVHQQIIWVKDRPILTRSVYMWQHEPCFFGWVKGQAPRRLPETEFLSTTWQIPTIPAGEKTDHPTSKPVDLFAIPMRQHTRVGDICYEPFSGSGSQFVAGEMTGRLVYGLELQPVFCAVILERLAGMGLAPQLVSEDT